MTFTPEELPRLAFFAAVLAATITALGEWLHARRIRRLSSLAFGPSGKARTWTKAVPFFRILAVAAVAWSLVTLVTFDNRTREKIQGNNLDQHLVVLLDVSPSMLLVDAGSLREQSRKQRANEVLKSILDRLPDENVRFTVIAFYTEARTLVEKCRDRELVMHLASETPFHITYQPGKTDLLGSLNQAGKLIENLPRKSATLLVLADGDSLPPTGLKPMPSSVREVLVVGVGDPIRGEFIDGHQSRQDTANLAQLARRLDGKYHDANLVPLPREAIDHLVAPDPDASKWQLDRRLLALVLLATGTALLCLIPLFLSAFGSPWQYRPASNLKLRPSP